MPSSTQWRVYVTAVNGIGSHQVQLAELEMHTSIGGADVCTGGTASASSSFNPSNNHDKAFDNDQGTRWWSLTGVHVAPQWIQYTFGASQDIVEFSISSGTVAATSALPQDFELQYYDGADWVTLYTITGETGWSASETRTWSASTATEVEWQFRAPWEGPVEWQFRAVWTDGAVGWQFRAPWFQWLDWQFRAPTTYVVDWQLRAPWAENALTNWQLQAPWAELDYTVVDWQFRAPWTETVDWQFQAAWGEPQPVNWTLSAPWAEGRVEWQFRAPWKQLLEWQFRAPTTYAHDVSLDFQFRAPWTDLAYDVVDFRLRAPWVERADVYQTFSDDITATVDGRTIPLETCSINADLDSSYWQLRATLARVTDYALFTRDKAFTIDFYGTTYSFILDTRTLQRGNDLDGRARDEAAITGLSPLALKANPRANGITKTYTAAQTAKQIVEDLIGAVTWECLDWPIPANRFGVENTTPLEAARQITDAIGAVILSTPAGATLIRSRYPVTIPDYDDAQDSFAPDGTLTASNIYAAQETVRADRLINRITINNGDPNTTAEQDRLEFTVDTDNPLKGVMRGYLTPWTTHAHITTTRSGVSLSKIGTQYRIEEETIEIRAGRGNVAYPVIAITGVTYLDDNLGGVSFEGDAITTSIAGYSLLKIKYRTRALSYNVTATSDRQAQFLLERI